MAKKRLNPQRDERILALVEIISQNMEVRLLDRKALHTAHVLFEYVVTLWFPRKKRSSNTTPFVGGSPLSDNLPSGKGYSP